jgi:hypothetical protein
VSDERDWSRLQVDPCPDCGYDAASLPPEVFEPMLVFEGQAWADWLATVDDADLRRRPEPSCWSALEYACHARDVLALFCERLDLICAEDDPDLGWWDHEAAPVEFDYQGQAPARVAAELVANARVLATLTTTLDPQQWSRTGRRRGAEAFTGAGLVRFALHELHHHRADAIAATTP